MAVVVKPLIRWLLLISGAIQYCNGQDVLAFKSKVNDWNYASPPRPARPSNPGTECGGTRTLQPGEYGIIESPGYPGTYSKGLDCEWSIETTPGSNIQATLFDVRTQNNLFADISDSLYMSLTGNWNDSQRYSGDFNPINPLVLLSQGNKLLIKFRSSTFSTGNRGFRIAYYSGDTGKPAATEIGHDVHTVVICNYFPFDHPQVWPDKGHSRATTPPENELSGLNRTNPNPFLVALILDEKQFCSGTLISEEHVITSAHCTQGIQRFDLVFGTPDLSLTDPGVQKRVAFSSDVTDHPYFDPVTGSNDISIIRLKENVTLTKFVFPAELPNWSFLGVTLSGFKGTMLGWGDTTKGTVYAQVGEQTTLIAPNTACRAINRGSSGLTMCSRSSTPETCQSDSGSPVILRDSICYEDDSATCNVSPQHPSKPKPNKPGHNKPNKPGHNKPNKPGNKPSKPSRPHLQRSTSSDKEGTEPYKPSLEELPRPLLLGVISHGTCDRGFSITRITAYLDFLTKNIGPFPHRATATCNG